MNNIDKEFKIRKEQIVSSLVEYVDPERRDKSPKGFIDAPILDLMHKINLHPDYYTTSSCSGRVAIYCEGINDEQTTTKGGVWLYVSHDPVEIPEDGILQLLFGDKQVVFDKEDGDILNRQLIYFKFEPLILHIEASSYETGMYLLAVASQVGYQNSGMTPSKRHMLAIRSTLKIDTPIAYLADDKIHCLVDPAYLRLLLEMANQKFHQNIKRMKIFEDAVQQELVKEDNKAKWESKEDRRERKRREGLEKKAAAQEKKKTEEEDDVADLLEESRIE